MLIMINTLMINFSSFNDHWLSLVVSGCLSVVICPSIQILVSLKNCLYLTKILCWKITHSITTVVHSLYILLVLRNHLCLETIVWHSFDQTMNIDLTVVMLTTRQKEHVSTLLLSIHLLTTIFDFMQENIWKIINHNHSNSRIQLYIIVNNEIK